MYDKSLLAGISPSRKEDLMERSKDMSSEVGAVNFLASRKSINHMEPEWIPHDCQHELLD
jgi:hypothetical protein